MSRDWKDWLTLDVVMPDDVSMVRYSNGKEIGAVVKDVDGYWKYSFSGAGLWEDSTLQMIADMLIELNMEWDESTKEYFDNERLEEQNASQVPGME